MILALPLLPLVVGFALIGAARLPRALSFTNAFLIGLVGMLGTAGLLAYTLVRPDTLDRAWIPSLGLRLSLGTDRLSTPLVILTVLIGLLAVLHSWVERPRESAATYLGCLLVVTGGAVLTFLARDAVLFFVAFEIVLIPMWVLISVFGDHHDPAATRRAGLTFVLYTVAGSILMLAGILALQHLSGSTDLRFWGHGLAIGTHTQTVVAALLLIGLAVKVPLWPLHSWLPGAHTAAPTGGSMLLAAVLLKMGTYGVIRLVVAPLHDGFRTLAPVLGALAVIGIIWAGLVCLAETGLKRIIAFSSVAHMGVVMLALASGTTIGLRAAMFGNLSHGLISALLFVVAGGLKRRWDGDNIDELREPVRDVSPRLGFALMIGLAASLGLPALAGFWPEVLTLFGTWANPHHPRFFHALAVIAAVGAVLGAAYSLRIARSVWAGRPDRPEPIRVEPAPWGDAVGLELVVCGVLVAAIVVLGVWPTGLLDYLEPAVRSILGGTR
ncbi:complex I subunit 4 family protein [Calidifontibacter terrae]